jgi:RHS repeat-associated protein
LAATPAGGSQTVQRRNHNRLNQITTFRGLSFTYDGQSGASNGNLANDGFRSYQFDALNRQIQVTELLDGDVIGTYVFDAFNRRIRKTISNGGFFGGIANGTIDYLYIGNQVMEERNPFGGTGSTDTPIRQYIWGTYIDECIQLTTLAALGVQNVPAGTYYLLQDLLYRAVALTNSSGGIVEAYDTDVYGQTILYTAPGPDGVWFTDDDVGSGFTYGANDLIFCGYRYDPETRLYYVRNRMFLTDAGGISVGRWIQRDPIGYAGGVNLYEYVGGRATVELDPDAFFPYLFALSLPVIVSGCKEWFWCVVHGDTSSWIPCNGDSQRAWAWTEEVALGVETMTQAAADADEAAFGVGCAEVSDAYLSFW